MRNAVAIKVIAEDIRVRKVKYSLEVVPILRGHRIVKGRLVIRLLLLSASLVL